MPYGYHPGPCRTLRATPVELRAVAATVRPLTALDIAAAAADRLVRAVVRAVPLLVARTLALAAATAVAAGAAAADSRVRLRLLGLLGFFRLLCSHRTTIIYWRIHTCSKPALTLSRSRDE